MRHHVQKCLDFLSVDCGHDELEERSWLRWVLELVQLSLVVQESEGVHRLHEVFVYSIEVVNLPSNEELSHHVVQEAHC